MIQTTVIPRLTYDISTDEIMDRNGIHDEEDDWTVLLIEEDDWTVLFMNVGDTCCLV